MDNETFVKLDFKQLPGQKFYPSMISGDVPSKYKFVLQDKFGKKAMIWQTICSCGLKGRTFVVSGIMNSDLYIKKRLQKRLLPFVRLHNSLVKFWPDLASIHYARSTMGWFEANKVDVIPKERHEPTELSETSSDRRVLVYCQNEIEEKRRIID